MIEILAMFIHMFRIFGNCLLICFFALSVVRLEISLRPFRFQQHNHGRLSLIWTLLIVGVPIAELLIRLLVVGHACDSGTEVVIRGLYQQDLTGFFGSLDIR
jgi:hypothetical protein